MPFMQPFQRPHTWECRIIPGDDGLYQGAEHGLGQLARGAMVHDDIGEAWGTVAWLPGEPHAWWLGRYPFYQEKGQPPVLGAAEIIFASEMGADLLLVETPARWVRLATLGPWDGPTACVLNWKRPAAVRLWLSLARGVWCENERLARKLDRLLDGRPATRRVRIRAEPQATKEAA